MKQAYSAILTRGADNGFSVFIPDFNINTQGGNLVDAIAMARDAIGIMGIDMEDEKKALPIPSMAKNLSVGNDDIVTMVDVDFTEYRAKNDQRSVKKNCTLPNWLCVEAEKSNINFSAVLQKALKQEMHITK